MQMTTKPEDVQEISGIFYLNQATNECAILIDALGFSDPLFEITKKKDVLFVYEGGRPNMKAACFIPEEIREGLRTSFVTEVGRDLEVFRESKVEVLS